MHVSSPSIEKVTFYRLKNEPCELVFLLLKDGAPDEFLGDVFKIVFYNSNKNRILELPEQPATYARKFELTLEQQKKLGNDKTDFLLFRNGKTIATGQLIWGAVANGGISEAPDVVLEFITADATWLVGLGYRVVDTSNIALMESIEAEVQAAKAEVIATKDSIQAQTGGTIARDDLRLVSGDEVAKKAVPQASLFENRNLYDHRNDVVGDFTINASTGALFPQANCSVSEIIDVTAVDKVVIVGRTGSGTLRFLSANGVPMKPLGATGAEAANYAGAWIGEFWKPPGATGFQFVTRYNGTTTKTAITVRGDSYPTEYIKGELIKKDGGLSLRKTGVSHYVSGKIGNNQVDITFNTRVGANWNSNPGFQLLDMRYNGAIFKSAVDDNSPLLCGAGHVGGNHGWSVARTLTLVAHGKTLADVGSVYSDAAGRDFVILRITSTSTLVICARNIGSGGDLTFPSPNGTLSYKSNGTNTSPMSGYTTASLPNLFSTIKLNRSIVLVDGKEATENGTFPAKNIQIVEDYDIYDLDSALAQLTALRPAGGYTTLPNLNDMGTVKLFNFSLTFNFWAPGKCTVTHSLLAYKAVPFVYFSAIQCFSIESLSGRLYIPKALPINGTQDFRLAPVFSTPAADILYEQSNGWEFTDNPPDRVLSFLSNGPGVHCGFIKDFGSGVVRKDNLAHAIRVAYTRKLYPMAVSQELTMIPAHTHYTFAAFYNVVDFAQNMGIATSRDMALCNGSLYIFLDYHAAGIDTIQLPTEWANRPISVVEKSANVQLISTAATGDLKTLSQVAAGSYGFIVLKIT